MLRTIKSKVYSIALLLGKIKYNNRSSKVLYYHDVHEDGSIPETDMSTPMSLFKRHIEIIRSNGYDIVDVITEPDNQIMLTFDDGYTGIYKNRSFFIEQGIKPTVFLITDTIGVKSFMGQKELYLLAANGFRFQSHTQSHPDLNLLSIDELKSEYVGSRNILYNFFDVEIKEICFPKGFFNYSTIAVAYESGYEGLYSSIPGSFHEKNDFNIIYRNLVQFSSPFDFKCILFGGLNIFRNRYTKQHYHEQ